MYIFRPTFRTPDGAFWHAPGVCRERLMDMFSYDVAKLANVHYLELHYIDANNMRIALQFAGVTRDFKLEDYARQHNINYEEISMFKDVLMEELMEESVGDILWSPGMPHPDPPEPSPFPGPYRRVMLDSFLNQVHEAKMPGRIRPYNEMAK